MTIGILAADRRMDAVAARLSTRFLHVTLHHPEDGIESMRADDVLIFPLPMAQLSADFEKCVPGTEGDLCERLIRALPGDKLLLGGAPDPLYIRLAEEYGSVLVDYYDDETVRLRNAIPTAEAALAIAVEKLPYTIHGSTFAITGYGKCARALALRIRSLGGRVTVAARRDTALAEAMLDGCETMPLAEFLTRPPSVRCVYNTIPAKIFPAEFCARLPEDTLFVELAGERALPVCDRVLYAPGLPAKTAPESAGEILSDAILPRIRRYQQTHVPKSTRGGERL